MGAPDVHEQELGDPNEVAAFAEGLTPIPEVPDSIRGEVDAVRTLLCRLPSDWSAGVPADMRLRILQRVPGHDLNA